MKKWIYKQYDASSDVALNLAQECCISPVTAAVALNRGLLSKEDINKFINISEKNFHSPFLMKDMEKAVEIITAAIHNNKKITIYGDYDVDGITSVTLLMKYLRSKGADVSYYIPSRLDEGYGVNEDAIRKICNDGTQLLITVDTGITACDEIRFAKQCGLEVVVTDHHQCHETLPDCPILNPCRADCGYPFKLLCGAGVVFKLLCALEGGGCGEIIDKYIDIVALGTIADVVNLEDENRAIVYYGIKKLAASPTLGIRSLLDTAGYTRTIDASSIGFGIAPRINAAGRIGDTDKAVNLLLSESYNECTEISSYLDEENKLRQSTEHSILKAVYNIIENDTHYEDKKVLIIAGTGWHHGIIGIVASRVTERYNKPCVLISCENGVGKGSGRSVKGFNLFEALNSCNEIFEKFGGHELAVGLTISQDNISAMDEAVNRYADKYMNEECLVPYIEIDTEISAEHLTLNTVNNLELLEPYGNGNPKPVFAVCDAIIKDIRLMSEGKHIKLTLEKDNVIFDAVGFGKGELSEMFIIGDKIDIAGILQINIWNNYKKLQMHISDIKLSLAETEKYRNISPVPTREDMAAVYRYIKSYTKTKCLSARPDVLARKISYEYSIVLSEEKLINCMDILTEMRLTAFANEGGCIDAYLLETEGKVDLEKSQILQKLRETEER